MGNWGQVDKRKLPHGLKPIAEYVRLKGLKFGLWFEPERVIEGSELAQAHPEWILWEHEREPASWFREIMPSIAGYIAISFTLGMINAIFLQVGLVFLGLVPLSGNNWGVMLQLAWVRGAIFFKGALMYILAPVIAISLLQLALILMARSMEEVFNPRLRGGH